MINENEFVFEGDLATCAENYEVSADTKTKVSFDSKYLPNYLIIFRLRTAICWQPHILVIVCLDLLSIRGPKRLRTGQNFVDQ